MDRKNQSPESNRQNVFRLELLHPILDPLDGNSDALVHFENGEIYGVTFFTKNNILSLMENWRQSGEYFNGAYFWAIDSIIVDVLEQSHLEQIIEDVLRNDEQVFCKYFTKIHCGGQ